MKVYIKIENPIIKFGDIEIEKQNICPYERTISKKIQILMKQQYLIKSLLIKKVLDISLVTKMLEK